MHVFPAFPPEEDQAQGAGDELCVCFRLWVGVHSNRRTTVMRNPLKIHDTGSK